MSDAFDDAFAVLAAAADVPGCKARLTELKKQLDAVEKASARLDADLAAHERAVAEATAASDEREQKLRDREVKVAFAERDIAAREKVIADARPPRFSDDPNLGLGGRSHSGLTREAS
jgi:chromosome segregation ATPase